MSVRMVNVVGSINYPVTEAKCAKSQSNHGAWVSMLLSRKSYTLTIGYNFWPSGKRLIQQFVSKSMSRVLFSTGQLLRGRLLQVTSIVP